MTKTPFKNIISKNLIYIKDKECILKYAYIIL